MEQGGIACRMLKRSVMGIALLFFSTLALHAETDPGDLVVFPAILPPAPAIFDDSSPPVVRWDKVPESTQEGFKLISAAESTSKSPEALMAYDSGGGETLLVQVVDDAKVLAPATRMGQERLLGGGGPPFPGAQSFNPVKVTIHPSRQPALAIDGYLTRRDPREPLLVLVVPDGKNGADRFVVSFTWLSARDDRAEIMAARLQKAAATIDIAKLLALP